MAKKKYGNAGLAYTYYKKREEEEKKKSSSSTSASKSANTTTAKNGAKSAGNTSANTTKKKTTASYLSPFYVAGEQKRKAEKEQKQAEKDYNRYANNEIDSTVYENMGYSSRVADKFISDSKAATNKLKKEAEKRQENMKLARMDDSTLERLGYNSYEVSRVRADEEAKQRKLTAVTATKGKENRSEKLYSNAREIDNRQKTAEMMNGEVPDAELIKSRFTEDPWQKTKDKYADAYNSAKNSLPEKYLKLIENNPDFDMYVSSNDSWKKEFAGEDVTDTEKAIYGYLKDRLGGSVSGEFYWDYIYQAQAARKASEKSKEISPFAKAGQAAVEGLKDWTNQFSGKNELVQDPDFGDYLFSENVNNAGKVGGMVLKGTRSVTNILPTVIASKAVGKAALSGGASAKQAKNAANIMSGALNYNNSYQQAIQEAIREGKSISDARLKAKLTAGAETVTQHVLGGIKGLGSGKGVFAKLASSKFGTKAVDAVQTAMKSPKVAAAMKAIGRPVLSGMDEASEEYLQSAVIAPLIDGIVDGKLPQIDLTSPEAVESAIIGFVTGGMFDMPDNITKATADFQRAGEISRVNKTESYGTDIFSKTINQNAPNTEVASNVSENKTKSNNLPLKNANTFTEQNRGGLNGGVQNIISVDTKESEILVKDLHNARTTFVDYFRRMFPKSVVNKSTEKEIGIPRRGIDKFLSGNISKEKLATGYKIPELIETAVKVNEADYYKDKDNINGYEYYDNNITIDGKEYMAHIRVKNTNMGDKYYGHTISVVDNIEIEPLARTHAENSASQPVHAVGSINNSIPQPDPTVNPENSQNSTEQPPTQTQPEVVGSGGEGTPPPTNNSENNQRILVTSKDVKGENNTPFKERMREAVRKFKTRFTATSEAFERADKKNGSDLTNRFYDALTSKAVADYNITDKQTDKNGNAIGKGLNEIFSRFYKKVKTNRSGDFKSMGKELIDPDYFAQVQNYVYAKHNLERAAEGKGFLSDKLAWTAEQIAEFEAAHPDAVEFQQELVGYYRNMLLNSVDSRLIAKEDAESFMQKYPNYVPTLRSMDGSNALDAIASSDVVDMLKGEGYAGGEAGYNVSTGIRKAGDNKSLSILPLYEQAQARTYAFIKNQMRNDFSNAVAEQGQNIEDVSNIKALHHKDGRSTAGNEVVFYRDGKKYSMRISDSMRYGFDELYNKVTEQSNDVISKVGRGLMSFFKNAITEWNPVFLIRNFVRDGFDALIYTKDIKKFAESVPAAFSEIVNNGELWQLYRAKGGMSDTRITKNNQYKKPNKLSQFNQLVEQLPRFVEFCATLKGTSMTDADIRQAMQNARDITVNFQRGGKWTKAANRTIVPFLNPSVQGLSKTVRTLSDVKQGNLKNTCIALGKLTGKLAMFGIVPSIVNELLLGDDEEYKLIDERIKQSYYIIKVGDTKFFMLPKGRMMSVVGEIGRNGAKYINGDEVNWSDFISNAVNQQGVVNPFESNIFMPIARLAGNKTWYGGEIESKWEVDNRNFNDRYNDSTPEWAKQISNFAYNHLGDNAFTDAFLGPKKIENFVDSYAGVFGDAAIGLGRSTNAQNPFEEVGKRLANTFNSLVTDKFISDTGVKNNVASQYYDMQKQMQRQFGSSGAAIDKFTSDFFKNNSDDIDEKNELYKKATQSGNSEAARKYKEQIDILMQDSMNNVEAYKAVAEKVLANYANFDYGSASKREKTYIQMQIDNAYGGAEYALKELGESQYENAVEARDTSGIPLDLSYKYYEHKQSLPSDVVNNEAKLNDEILYEWLPSQTSTGAMTQAQANALATHYVKKSISYQESYHYDLSSPESTARSQWTETENQRYEYAKQLWPSWTTELYNQWKDVYGSGKAEEKKYRLIQAGMTAAQAEAFHKIQSGSKGYKTESATTRIGNALKMNTQDVAYIIDGYDALNDADPMRLQKKRSDFLDSIVEMIPENRRLGRSGQEIKTFLYNVLSAQYYTQ